MDGRHGGELEQKVFGAGINRKWIAFVPAGTDDSSEQPSRSHDSIGKRYLSLVLEDPTPSPGNNIDDGIQNADLKNDAPGCASPVEGSVCEICKMPVSANEQAASISLSTPHDLTLAHQVCVQHTYPPSHLDRNRQGLRYLSSYGWDVDSRKGLGAAGEGRRAPIKATSKNDTVGLGMKVPGSIKKIQRVELLDAGRIRKKGEKEKKTRARLQEMFYRNDDVEKYLGGS